LYQAVPAGRGNAFEKSTATAEILLDLEFPVRCSGYGRMKFDRKSGGVAAIILAAGNSTRMGEAKQLLRLGAGTVLGQTIENVRRSRVDQIVLVLGSSADAIRRQLPVSLLEGLKVVINPAYEQGMASSLQAGLSALDEQVNAALIVLADQPFIRPQTLNQIAQHASRAQIVIPCYRGVRGNPVLLDRSVFAEVMALQGDVGCRAIFGSHMERTLKLKVEDEGILLDMDSREDYERLRGETPPPIH
jgi:molybdenum cofactor cytidylyltransferase